MKHFCILLFVILSGIFPSSAQTVESLFTVNGNSFTVQSKFIEPFYFENQNTPSFLFKSYKIYSADSSCIYTLKLSNYKGSEVDPGYFRIIDVEQDGKNILSLKQSEGWNNLSDVFDHCKKNDFFYQVPLSGNRTALIFEGYYYSSQPPLLTIVVLDKGTAKLILNKGYIINKVESTPEKFVMSLQDECIEYVSPGYPANTANSFRIWKEDGLLKFGGPYEKVTK